MSHKKRHRAASLLDPLASALSACERAGIHPRLRHGVVYTDLGYVLPTNDGWVVRTLAYLPFSTPVADPDLTDD